MPLKIINPKSQISNPKHPPSPRLRGIVLRSSKNEGGQIPNSNVKDSKPIFWLLVIWSSVVVCNLVLGVWNFIYAAPCYGTKMPEKKEFFTGFQTHTIFKRYLEDEYGKVRSFQNFLLISYGVYDWLSIDLKGGAGNIKQHPLGSDEVDYRSGFAGGYGFRLKLYDDKKIKTVFGFQHISIHPKSTHLGTVRNKAILDDWQASLLASFAFKNFTPYLGTRWSRIDYIHTVADSRKRKMSDATKSIGFIFGLDFPLTEKSWLNLEGNFFDSEAVAFSLNFSF